MKKDLLSEEEFARSLEERLDDALSTPARPMTSAQIAAIVQEAEKLKKLDHFPVWVLVVFTCCLVVQTLGALLSVNGFSQQNMLLAALPAVNLVAAPFAAFTIIKYRRRNIHEN